MKEGENNEKSNTAKKEEEVLKFWQENRIFEKSLEQTAKGESFVFYDGPPFATGLPHYGHLLAGTIKDAIPRYQTMKGKHVRRKWGWDCHGLPIENLIETDLNLKNKKDIEDLGIGNFNEKARESVYRYDSDWKKIVPRTGRFIDMEEGYSTMNWQYSESIWWAFKELYNKGLIYEGHKSMHICPRCETTLAISEVTQGYRDITDISITAKFELIDESGTFVLAWTTTPWTLPGNVALAVGPDLDYVKIRLTTNNSQPTTDESFILAKEKVEEVFEGNEYEVVEELKGKDLIGKKYKPVFDYYSNSDLENKENGWKIYGADFVTTESGTGVVHIAPSFGEDDMVLGKEFNLPFVQHVSMDGLFKKEVTDFAGTSVKPKDDHQKTDIEIIKYLAHQGLLFSKKKIIHPYPHCWRCDTPLLNYAATSWFVGVTEIKEKMVKLNDKVNWNPEAIGKGRFGKWLEGARDWAISRSRFWGAPLPVWKCSQCEKIEVIGSVEDIKKKTSTSGNKYFGIRHGEAESNSGNIVSSKVDNPHHLTEEGRKQTLEAIKDLKNKKIDVIFYSDFVRTTETAEIISKELGVEMIVDERIREINTGDFDGKNLEEYRGFFPVYEDRFVKTPPHGENLIDVKKRVNDFFKDLDNKYQDKNILIVSHEYPLWMMASVAEGLDVEDTVGLREGRDDFPNNAEIINIDYAPIPHNSNFELDLHRPYIDEIKFKCSCGEEMKRIPEVFDCWFESGSMPYAQFHYPFENKKEFKNNFPADFIAEGVDQTRGWFYNMLILATGLFGKSAFNAVIVNGMILAEDGQKMAKKLKNYPDPVEVMNKYGADSLRYYLLSSPAVKGEDLSFSEKGVDEINKKIIGRLNNVYSFFDLYQKDQQPTTNNKQPETENILDQWILARLSQLIEEVSVSMDKYQLDKATRPIALFVDDLSTWYLRRSRDRFKGEDEEDKQMALNTLHFTLLEFSKTIAPFMPFAAEDLYQKLEGQKESVHLEAWPKSTDYRQLTTNNLLDEMEEVRNIVSLALERRSEAKMKVRQPLNELKIKNFQLRKEYEDLIKDELNVKNVSSEKGEGEIVVELDLDISPELKKEGQYRELLRHVQQLRKKEGLTPEDIVVLIVESNEEGRDLVDQFRSEMEKTSLLKEIKFEEGLESEEINVDDLTFKLRLLK